MLDLRHARSAIAAITFESWLPCHAIGERPGSSVTSRAPGIAAAYASPISRGCSGSGSSSLATTAVGAAIAPRSAT